MQTTKYIHEFKEGDIVHAHGALFKIVSGAQESQAHRPQAGHLQTAFGPCDVAWAIGKWISGESITGYFGPSNNWVFQGNFRAGKYKVELA